MEVGGLGDRQRLRLEVVDDESAAALLVRVIPEQLDSLDLREVGIRCRLHHDLASSGVERHREAIVRQYFVRDFRYLRKHRADVEDAGDRAQQLHGIFQVGGAVPFESGTPRAFRQPLVRERNRDVVGDALGEGQLTL